MLYCPFSHEMSRMRSGTELSQFLRIFPIYSFTFYMYFDLALYVYHKLVWLFCCSVLGIIILNFIIYCSPKVWDINL